MRIPRTRGAVSGVLLIVLGAWGALVPFVGHYFNFVIGSDRAWDFSAGRFWLSLLPGVVVALGGVLLLLARTRPTGGFGAWLAMAGGGWFAIGPSLSQLWNHGISQTGPALGGTGQRVAEQLAYFYGLGTLIIAVAGFALGRLAVRSVRDAELEAETAAAAPADPAADQARRTRESGRFGRESEPVAAGAQTDTLTAADRVQTAAQTERRGIFRRRSV